MSENRDDRGRTEMPAVRTTIVGGRPPGCGKGIGKIPRGIEVLVKKASVDDEFRKLLLETRARAASEIGLELDSAEVMMLNGVPRGQLETIIANTRLRPTQRKLFMGRAAAVMLAALGTAAAVGCDQPVVEGIRPEVPGDPETVVEEQAERPVRPTEKIAGVRPLTTEQGEQPAAEEPVEEQATERLDRPVFRAGVMVTSTTDEVEQPAEELEEEEPQAPPRVRATRGSRPD